MGKNLSCASPPPRSPLRWLVYRVAVIDLWFHWFSRDLVKVEINWLETKKWPECKVVASIRNKHMGGENGEELKQLV